MIVYGMLVGNLPDDVVTDQKPIINRVIEAICECFTGVNTNEDVQLQIIKVIFILNLELLKKSMKDFYCLVVLFSII